jgi:putative sugar O-methyltransferase
MKLDIFILKFLKIGLINILKEYFNKKFVFKVPSSVSDLTKSSILDSDSTLNFREKIKVLSSNSDNFAKFRRSDVLISAMEHVSVITALEYAALLPNLNQTQKFLDAFDKIGAPFRYKINGVTSSPVALRYLKILEDLVNCFGPLSHESIVEIGGGFGGQAAVILNRFPNINYTIFDLPEVNQLAQIFLQKLDLKVEHRTRADLNSNESLDPIDIVISNYAFSELNRENQIYYLEKFILKAKKGYMIWNNLSEKKLGGLSLADLIRIIPNSQVLPEIPLTSDANALVIWSA